MKYQLVIIGFNLSVLFASGQAPVIEWQICLGGSGTEVPGKPLQTIDRGHIITGSTLSNDGDVIGQHGGNCGVSPCADGWVIKIDSTGNVQWKMTLGGTRADGFSGVVETSEDGFVLAGGTESFDGDVSGNHSVPGYADVWVIKLDSLGSLVWQKCFGGSGGEVANSISQTNDHGFILVGETGSLDFDVSGNHSADGDIWVVKLDSMGNLQWQKCIGGSVDDYGNSGQQTYDGGYVIAGYANSDDGDIMYNSNNSNMLYYNACLIKLDSSGTIEFSKTYGGSSWDKFNSVIQIQDSGYVMVGTTSSNDFDISGLHGQFKDAFVMRTDKFGNLIDQRCYGGSSHEFGRTIMQTVDGGYILGISSGSADGDVTGSHGDIEAWVVKLDSSLDIEWEECLGGSFQEDWTNVIQLVDGSYLLAASTLSDDQQVSGNHQLGVEDIWVVKLSQANVSVPEQEKSIHDFQVYINNSSNFLSLCFQSDNAEQLTASIYDPIGRLLNQNILNSTKGVNNVNIKINPFSNGIYFVSLQNKEGRIVKKIIASK